MKLLDIQESIRLAFSSFENISVLPNDVELHVHNFESDISSPLYIKTNELKEMDYNILSNRELISNTFFKYFMFIPPKKVDDEAIIMLHGLNERSWDKYMLWAYYLALKSNKAVILFPIAYHINRAPDEWSNPRLMSVVSKQRVELNDKMILKSSYANVALSLRLSKSPELFWFSGLQTYFDIIKLVKNIKSGNHKHLPIDTKIDFFSYSIGAFLTEILFMSNPEDLFTNQKAFLFCGGSTFDDMNAISKSILDSGASDSLMNYFLNNKFVSKITNTPKKYLKYIPDAFKSFVLMLNKENFKKERISKFVSLKPFIKAVGLAKDIVIPPKAILETVGDCEIIDFPVNYSHENPFPFNNKRDFKIVEDAFITIFDKAVDFLK